MVPNIIEKLIDYYIEKEKTSHNDYCYYTHTECDNNVTEFEGLSNSNKIGIYTNLEPLDAKIILKILDALYQKNFYLFDGSSLGDLGEDTEYENVIEISIQ